MQCIDYPFRNQLGASIVDMVRKDGAWMFIRGMPIFFIGGCCQWIGSTAAERIRMYQIRQRFYNEMNEPETKKEYSKWEENMEKLPRMFAFGIGVLGFHFCNVVGTHVIYARFNKLPID